MTVINKGRRRRPLATLVVCGAGVWLLCLGVLGVVTRVAEKYTGVENYVEQVGEDKLLGGFDLVEDMGSRKGRRPLSEHKEDLNCTPRSLENFPGDFFTDGQREKGGVAVHIFISIYIFAALAVVCDDYFVASLEVICDVMKLQPDVAGATFMAAGSSAPELFTSVVGVFLAKSDVGVGTIVGSAVFNILFIVAMCGIGAGMVIHLTWWPLTRDCLFYTLSIVTLVIVIHDEQIHWYESTVMLVMYMGYIVIMYFNPRLGAYLMEKVNTWQQSRNPSEKRNVENGDIKEDNILTKEDKKKNFDPDQDIQKKKSQESLDQADGDGDPEEFESPLTFPETWPKRIFWLLLLPVTLVYMITIPDCRRGGCWRKLFMVTFVMSIVWIAGLTYLMVWMVTIIGDTWRIPDTVMGLTLLAAGTSVPDALASLFVARDGLGDMAVSNSIGSNVFDILIGLGLPWLLHSAVVSPGTVVWISSGGMTFSAITLIGTVLFLLIAVAINKWRLTKILGVICMLVYAVFVTFAILYELNVFMDVNPPACPRH